MNPLFNNKRNGYYFIFLVISYALFFKYLYYVLTKPPMEYKYKVQKLPEALVIGESKCGKLDNLHY